MAQQGLREILKIIEEGESETTEFKKSLGEKKEILETISAFANTDGGLILIGVTDDGEIKGVDIGKKTLEDLAEYIKRDTDPSQRPSIRTVKIDSKSIISVKVKKSKLPVSVSGKYFKRVGKTNQPLTSLELAEMLSKKNLIETKKTKLTPSLLDKTLLKFLFTLFAHASFNFHRLFTFLIIFLVGFFLVISYFFPQLSIHKNTVSGSLFLATYFILLMCRDYAKERRCKFCGSNFSLIPVMESCKKYVVERAILIEKQRTFKCMHCGKTEVRKFIEPKPIESKTI